MIKERATYLLEVYQNGKLSHSEKLELIAIIEEGGGDLEPALGELIEIIDKGSFDADETRKQHIYQHIEAKIAQELSVSVKQVHRTHFLKTNWFRYAAAIILILGIGAYIFIAKQKNIVTPGVAKIQDKAPGTDKATLTLSDGRKIILNDSATENISDGSISIEKANGILTYNTALTSAAEASAKAAFNTMATPRGGQYQLILPDGSKVWMNSASTLKYPTVFTGKERTVELSGEAYFDIKANKKMPFVVKTEKAEVLVLGTEFNVNSYFDEPEFSTTLVNGSVKVSAGDKSKIITPGQQARLSNSRPNILEIKNDIDINQVIAWQKGIFRFDGVSLDIISRQLARWYDVDIIVRSSKVKKLSGGIAKKTPLRNVLENLEAYGITNRWESNVITLYSN